MNTSEIPRANCAGGAAFESDFWPESVGWSDRKWKVIGIISACALISLIGVVAAASVFIPPVGATIGGIGATMVLAVGFTLLSFGSIAAIAVAVKYFEDKKEARRNKEFNEMERQWEATMNAFRNFQSSWNYARTHLNVTTTMHVQKALKLLGFPEGTDVSKLNKAAVEKQYKKIMMRCHPDKVRFLNPKKDGESEEVYENRIAELIEISKSLTPARDSLLERINSSIL